MVGSPRRRGAARYRGRQRTPVWAVLLGIAVVAALAVAAVRFLRPAPAPGEADEPSAPPVEAQALPSPSPTPEPLPAPPEVRGIYVSGPVAGDPYMDALIQLLDDTELNAVVIDVKNDEGHLTYQPAAGTAVELGACVRYIRDLPELVHRLKEHGVYTIARVAAFKDPVLASARPELTLRRADGTAASESGGAAWVDPYRQEVWDYLIEAALGVAGAGFDEVQFDYVRFPTGKGAQDLDDSAAAGRSKEDAVVGFLEAAREALHAQGVLVSADVFGIVMGSSLDAGLVGQDYARMSQVVDYLCPMVYPSHYAAGTFGLDVPDREPYQTVRSALEKSRTALSLVEGDRAGVRAWLQDFTATWVKGHITYGGEERRAQIQAVCDAGYTDWLLWNAKNTYPADGLLPSEE